MNENKNITEGEGYNIDEINKDKYQRNKKYGINMKRQQSGLGG
jgi:hypothetical protein